jgi:hypothetical protein
MVVCEICPELACPVGTELAHGELSRTVEVSLPKNRMNPQFLSVLVI